MFEAYIIVGCLFFFFSTLAGLITFYVDKDRVFGKKVLRFSLLSFIGLVVLAIATGENVYDEKNESPITLREVMQANAVMQANPVSTVPRIVGSGIRRVYSIESFENSKKRKKGTEHYYIENGFNQATHDALFKWISFKYDLDYGVLMSIECATETWNEDPPKMSWSDVTQLLESNDSIARVAFTGDGYISDVPFGTGGEGALSGCNYLRIVIYSPEDGLFWRVNVKKWAVYLGG